ncbi:hypothetical protein BMW23_0301 [Bodo saltans virus]|uniref:Transmembrane protein n=1 Tax=Bodo saltans virus TaxID=2024608 RepID=A0A2H4UU46_9VIRU|nr:hypothetical protein QJ851_gp0296 [Bodo saltans virus]ATZ80359.1 hypothetical protein BMW23_0301 [Bodo saltans virus]
MGTPTPAANPPGKATPPALGFIPTCPSELTLTPELPPDAAFPANVAANEFMFFDKVIVIYCILFVDIVIMLYLSSISIFNFF